MNDPGAIVVDCAVCFRTMWAGSICYHGACPPPMNDGTDVHANNPKPDRVKPVSEKYKEKNRDRHRPRPEG